MAEEWTIGRLLQWTSDYLKQHGAESPRLEAEVLLAHARGCKRVDLYTSFGETADDALRTRFRELVKRRAEGVPFAYLAGKREFYSLDFKVTPDVLIPRPETEFLVIGLLDLIKTLPAGDEPIDVVDVGTGSGIIAISVAKHAPRARVTAVDISPAALAVAGENVAMHGLADRVELVESDLLAALPADRQYDFIASNPPYITTAEYAELAPEVREHEPQGALVAGPQGTEVIERLLPQAAERLRAGGVLLLEISPMLQQRVESLIAGDAAWELLPIIKDLAGHARVVRARRTGS
jgi:release factor glutamine methyltransferase